MHKRINYLIIFSFLINTIIYGQFSVHKEQNDLFGISNHLLSKYKKEDIIPLNKSKVKSLSKLVYGFLPDWEYSDGAHLNFKYELLTHIACFDFVVNENGGMDTPGLWPWTDLINSAHQNGVKVHLTAVNFDADEIRTLLNSNDKRKNLIDNIKYNLNFYNLDGVNIDFEGMYSSEEGATINSFMAQLRDSLKNVNQDWEVTIAGPAINWGGDWDFAGLAEAVDYIFIMGYAYSGSWSTITSPNAPTTGGTYNITSTVNSQYAAVTNNNPEKLILGLPYYGVQWITESQYAGADVVEFINYPRYTAAQNAADTYGSNWSSTYQNPYVVINDGSWKQIWYDDIESMGDKFDLAVTKNLAGIGMWALGYDDGSEDLWNLIDLDFGSGLQPFPEEPSSIIIKTESDSSVLVEFTEANFSDGYYLYYGRDGMVFPDSIQISGNQYKLDGLEKDSVYYFRIKSFNSRGLSNSSEVLAASLMENYNKVLIVNGFDRIDVTNTRDYIRYYTKPLKERGYGYSSASNESVFKNEINLNDYETVIWILGEESSNYETFNSMEQEKVIDFLKNGGKFFVSGSEIGWDLGRSGVSGSNDISFYQNYLRAVYKEDAPNGSAGTYYTVAPYPGRMFDSFPSFNFDNGSYGTYDVRYPDAIRSRADASEIFIYAGVSPSISGSAGLAFQGIVPDGTEEAKIIYLAFPFETIYPEETRVSLFNRFMDFYEGLITSTELAEIIPTSFSISDNYPNPFNPSTSVKVALPYDTEINVKIYSITGEIVKENNIGIKRAGNFIYNFELSELASGVYIYEFSFSGFHGIEVLRNKMILMK